MSYAVIKTGGKQYRVQEGQTLLVERLPDEPGATIDLTPLLLAGDGDPVLDAAKLAKSPVKAEIVGHERGKKLRVFKFKPKRGYRRRTGHRQELTRIRVTSIGGAAAKPKRSRTKKAPEPEEEPQPRGRRRRRAKPEDDGGGVEAEAVQALTEGDSADAGTAPSALEDAANGDDENGDALSSRTRRRGRRGGRRRSRAKASADADASE